MSDADFYNRNLYRRYPFEDQPKVVSGDVPDGGVVDLGLVFFTNAGFDPASPDHFVFPLAVIRQNSHWRFFAGVWAPGTPVHKLIIRVEDANPVIYKVHFLSLSVADEPVGYAFLVAGDPEAAVTKDPGWTPDFPADPATAAAVEPALIQVQTGHYVRRFIIANEPRTYAVDPCLSELSSSIEELGYEVAPDGEAVVGDVRFCEGYNCEILVLPNNNALRFSARAGAGRGEACVEIPRTYAERARLQEDPSAPLDGAARCYEIISSINGVEPDAGGRLGLIPGRGVVIEYPDDHTIRILARDDLEECT